jgi:hypothetical protein
MSELIVASFDDALQAWTDKFGPIPQRISGMSPYLFGADDAPGGYHARSDVGERTTQDGTPLETVWDEFSARLGIFNRQHSLWVTTFGSFVDRTTTRVAIPRRAKMERATEFGQPSLVRTERVPRGFYLEHWDIGIGFTQEFLDDATDAEIQANRVLVEEAYWNRQRTNVLELLMLSTNFTDAKEGINVKRLYNGDGEVPPEYDIYSFDGAHSHYLTSAGAALVQTDLEALELELLHHGYGDNAAGGAGGEILVFASRDLVAKIRGFANFIPAETSQVAEILPDSGFIVGNRASGAGWSIEGTLNRMAIIESTAIPAGYLVGMATGGALSPNNPVGIRRHSNASARGLRLNPGRSDYPLMDSFYDAYIGGGVMHRGAAAVMQETAGAYTDPTF